MASDTIPSLVDRLVALSLRYNDPQPRSYFVKRVDQSAVEDWNAFMRRSHEYHAVIEGSEKKDLKSCMGDLKQQYRRCVRGETPPSGAASWETYFRSCEERAERVRQKQHRVVTLRAQALSSAEAVRMVKRGLFSERSWLAHSDQIIGQMQSRLDAEQVLLDLDMYRTMSKTESAKYRADPKGYKFPKFEYEALQDHRARELGRLSRATRREEALDHLFNATHEEAALDRAERARQEQAAKSRRVQEAKGRRDRWIAEVYREQKNWKNSQ